MGKARRQSRLPLLALAAAAALCSCRPRDGQSGPAPAPGPGNAAAPAAVTMAPSGTGSTTGAAVPGAGGLRPDPERAPTVPKPDPSGAPGPSAFAPASSNLAGRDRFLAYRPLDSVGPSDFEIGALGSGPDAAGPASAASAFAAGLARRELASAVTAPEAARIMWLLHGEALSAAPPVTAVRVGEPVFGSGGATVPLRLFSAIGSAAGLVVLYPDSAGTWLVEYLDMDFGALAVPKSAPGEPFDPYRTPAP